MLETIFDASKIHKRLQCAFRNDLQLKWNKIDCKLEYEIENDGNSASSAHSPILIKSMLSQNLKM